MKPKMLSFVQLACGLPFITEELRTTSQNLSLVNKSVRTAVRALEVASQRHSLTGIGLRCDDTFLGAKAWRIPLSYLCLGVTILLS